MLSSIDIFRQPFRSPSSVSLAGILGLHKAASGIGPDAQVRGPELLVGYVGELVQPHLIYPVTTPLIMFVDEANIILKNVEPAVHLADSIVDLAMPCHPHLVSSPVHWRGLQHLLLWQAR